MGQLENDTHRVIADAQRLVADNREGGRHRRALSIGEGSKGIKSKNLFKKIRNVILAIVGIWVAAGIAGAILNGIGFWGVMSVVVLSALAIGFFSKFPKVKVPKRAELKQGNPKQMVARTELWLEAQRDALPAPAAAVVDQLGVQLDALGEQLEALDEHHPAMSEVRELVGEYIPETIDNYRKIPAHLRKEEHAGGTADQRLTESLTKLSGEVDRVTRRLAEGALDDLAVKSRYLEYRYGGDELLAEMQETPDTGVPLPDLDLAPQKTK